eukprot:gene325-biopygen1341
MRLKHASVAPPLPHTFLAVGACQGAPTVGVQLRFPDCPHIFRVPLPRIPVHTATEREARASPDAEEDIGLHFAVLGGQKRRGGVDRRDAPAELGQPVLIDEVGLVQRARGWGRPVPERRRRRVSKEGNVRGSYLQGPGSLSSGCQASIFQVLRIPPRGITPLRMQQPLTEAELCRRLAAEKVSEGGRELKAAEEGLRKAPGSWSTAASRAQRAEPGTTRPAPFHPIGHHAMPSRLTRSDIMRPRAIPSHHRS